MSGEHGGSKRKFSGNGGACFTALKNTQTMLYQFFRREKHARRLSKKVKTALGIALCTGLMASVFAGEFQIVRFAHAQTQEKSSTPALMSFDEALQVFKHAPGEIIIKLKYAPALKTRLIAPSALNAFAKSAQLEGVFKTYSVSEVRPLYPQSQTLSDAQLKKIYGRDAEAIKRRRVLDVIYKKRGLGKVVLIRSSAVQSDAFAQGMNLMKEVPSKKIQEQLWSNGVPDHPTRRFLDALKSQPSVEHAQFNYAFRAATDDPLYGEMWNLNNTGQIFPYSGTGKTQGKPDADIDAPEAWNIATKGGQGVVVAVVDSGIDYNHIDIRNHVWVNPGEDVGVDGKPGTKDSGEGDGVIQPQEWNGQDDDQNGFIDDLRGWDFVFGEDQKGDNDPLDDYGHGTHAAGVITAEPNNQQGIVGIAFKSKVAAVKGLSVLGDGTSADLSAAVYYTALIHADIANNSWIGPPIDEALREAFDAIYEAGIIAIVATSSETRVPSSFESVINATATTAHDEQYMTALTTPRIDVGAPGQFVLGPLADKSYFQKYYTDNIYRTNYFIASGSSVASAHVSGIAAMIKAESPIYGSDELRQILRMSTDDIGALGFDEQFGYGRVNLEKAVKIHGDVPTVKVRSLAHGDILRGGVTIQADTKRGMSFTLYAEKIGESVWKEFAGGAISGPTISYDWNTFSMADGAYYIKIVVLGSGENYAQDIKKVSIDNALIISPKQGEAFRGILKITGLAGGGQTWRLRYKQDSEQEWREIASAPVSVPIEFDWNTASVADGVYALKLGVQDGQYEAEDSIAIVVHNIPVQVVVAQDGSGQATTIQGGVKAVLIGDEVMIMPGIYRESALIQKSNIAITGFDKTTVIMEGDSKLAFGISIDPFLIRLGTDGTIISNITLRNYTEAAIRVKNSEGTRITNTIIETPPVQTTTPEGVALYGEQKTIARTIIENNELRGMNTSPSLRDTGIFILNYATAAPPPGGVTQNRINGNSITHFNDGIFMSNIQEDVISDNSIVNGIRGINFSASTNMDKNNLITHNKLADNKTGIQLNDGVNADNRVILNDFINNEKSLIAYVASKTAFDDGTTGNYWSDYTGTDEDHDKRGDTPYIIYNSNGKIITGYDNYPLMEPVSSLKPDLSPQRITLDPPAPLKLQEAHVLYEIANVGDSAVDVAGVQFKLMLDGTQIVEDVVSATTLVLEPGASHEFERSVSGLTENAGDHTVSLEIDSTQIIAETNEENNILSAEVKVISFGDINADGLISLEDADRIKDAINGVTPLSDEEQKRADANQNRYTDRSDWLFAQAGAEGVIQGNDLPLLSGDVNSDHLIDAGDKNLVEDFLAGKGDLSALQKRVADVNANAKVDGSDVLILDAVINHVFPNTRLPLLLGDVHEDGAIDQLDVDRVLFLAEHFGELDLDDPVIQKEILAADLNINRRVDTSDVLIVKRMAQKNITSDEALMPPIWLGDVTLDGAITSDDAALVLAYLDGSAQLTLPQQLTADVNASGIIALDDANIIARTFSDLIKQQELPLELPDFVLFPVSLKETRKGFYRYFIRVFNAGGIASGQFTIQIQEAGKKPREKTFQNLSTGASFILAGKASSLPITFVADPKNQIKELHEDNNSVTFSQPSESKTIITDSVIFEDDGL
ncbi:MAG: cell wall/surface repeat protein [Parcubacteria group bacterium GW2011_GWA2_44_12]|nr:MAG: cell wall/surface repeat protein [Parcubacteria group bacterium GW2011_GWA2_44_12]